MGSPQSGAEQHGSLAVQFEQGHLSTYLIYSPVSQGQTHRSQHKGGNNANLMWYSPKYGEGAACACRCASRPLRDCSSSEPPIIL
jgi:hypothetical protein